MSHRSRLIGLVLLLAGVLILVITGWIRPLLVVPVYQIVVAVRLFVESLPQRLIWLLLLVLAVPLVWRSVAAGVGIPRSRQDEEPLRAGPVNDWLMAMRSARQAELSRIRFAQAMRQLVLNVLVEQERLPEQRIWRRLLNGGFDIPPEVLVYLQGRWDTPSRRGWWRRRKRARDTAATLARLVDYLRARINQLEGTAK